jgi:hypothetical protein
MNIPISRAFSLIHLPSIGEPCLRSLWVAGCLGGQGEWKPASQYLCITARLLSNKTSTRTWGLLNSLERALILEWACITFTAALFCERCGTRSKCRERWPTANRKMPDPKWGTARHRDSVIIHGEDFPPRDIYVCPDDGWADQAWDLNWRRHHELRELPIRLAKRFGFPMRTQSYRSALERFVGSRQRQSPLRDYSRPRSIPVKPINLLAAIALIK